MGAKDLQKKLKKKKNKDAESLTINSNLVQNGIITKVSLFLFLPTNKPQVATKSHFEFESQCTANLLGLPMCYKYNSEQLKHIQPNLWKKKNLFYSLLRSSITFEAVFSGFRAASEFVLLLLLGFLKG